MKKYIVPVTDMHRIAYSMVICASTDGQGMTDGIGEPQGDSQGAPMRWIF